MPNPPFRTERLVELLWPKLFCAESAAKSRFLGADLSQVNLGRQTFTSALSGDAVTQATKQ
jgi:hypothetical protein